MNNVTILNPKTKETMTEENIKQLSKKTKAQLIDIISRKDATEVNYKEKISKFEEVNLENDQKINDLSCEIVDLKKIVEVKNDTIKTLSETIENSHKELDEKDDLITALDTNIKNDASVIRKLRDEIDKVKYDCKNHVKDLTESYNTKVAFAYAIATIATTLLIIHLFV